MNDLINRQEAIDILELGAEILRRVLDDMDVVGIDREKYSYGLKLLESDIEDIKELPPAQPEWGWHPITEKPPRGKDLILKIYDKRNLFYYYHMGFYSVNQYRTYNFFWQYDEDLEVVGWQLCPWEGE